MKILKTTGKKINNAIHLADIHIRLLKRHDEYKEVFDKLYCQMIDLCNAGDDDCVLIVAGDIFHNKSDLSPECIQMGNEFFSKCADILPTFVTAGNHDATLSNKNRLDCISPLINSLNHPNLYYLKDSGLFRYENILFNNYSIFDDPTTDYLPYDQIKASYKLETDHHIVLFHGPVNNATTDIGYIVSDRSIMPDIFDGHHIAMLGDIHKHQVLQQYDAKEEKPIIVYSSSLIQQNHGETLKGHGFLYWDLEDRSFEFHEVDNNYGYFTVELNGSELITDITDIPAMSRLRFKCLDSVPSQVKSITNELKNSTNIIESTFIRIEGAGINSVISQFNEVELHNIKDTAYQNSLIRDDLEASKTPEKVIRQIEDINTELNGLIQKDNLTKNIRWTPKSFEFDNMFSYGEGNVIDFTKLSGVVGLFAPNAAGKSSIFDAISFCMFDKFSRGFKAAHILNVHKNSFRCKFSFEISGVDYFIERFGVAGKGDVVKVNVNFWKDDNGVITELNGEARRNTNDIIRDYIGTYDDFLLTVLSVQNNKSGSFIDMGHAERKDLLSQFMGINIFDKLHVLANEKFKETNILLKSASKDELIEELGEIHTRIRDITTSIAELKNTVDVCEGERDSLSTNVIELSEQITHNDIGEVNIVTLEESRDRVSTRLAEIDASKPVSKEKLNSIEMEIGKLEVDLKSSDSIESDYSLYRQHVSEETRLQSKIENIKLVVGNKLEKLKTLSEYKYDPDCEFCVNNVFVKDAEETKKSIDADKAEARVVLGEYKVVGETLRRFDDIVSRHEAHVERKGRYVELTGHKAKLENHILATENQHITNTNQLADIKSGIANFYAHKDIIESNAVLTGKISTLKGEIKSLDYTISNNNTSIFSLNSNLGKYTSENSTINEKLGKVKDLEETYNTYKLYVDLISRDGIPYSIIKRTLPEIEAEINTILSQCVEFTVKLNSDGKNIVANLMYDDVSWPLEMACGLERFLTGFAIRVALINISNLPRPNIICVDEGWGCADSENIGQMGSLLSYLGTKFDFIWTISHLDKMRDMVDTQIEIQKENGFSKVEYI